MFKKIGMAFLVLATTTLFGMSLSTLNSASKDELMKINGVGEKKAAAIIKERKHGKFKSFEDLTARVKGVGAQLAANIKHDVKMGQKAKKVAKSSAKKSTKSKASKAKATTTKSSKTMTTTKSKAKKVAESLKTKAAKKKSTTKKPTTSKTPKKAA